MFELDRTIRLLPSLGVLLFALPIAVRAQERVESPDRSIFMTQRMPYAAFDRLPQQRIEVGKATLSIAFAPGNLDLDSASVIAWVRRNAEIIAKYYGHFPVESARILAIPVDGVGVKHGTSYGYRGAAIKVFVGEHATQAELDDDWVLPHEMVHFAFPSLDDEYNWMSEGQATYIENIARTQAGVRSVNEAWKEIVLNMQKGLPRPGDQGLDHTHTWGRTYWGGALFCLLADIEIHKRTDNRFGLREALRAVIEKGGVTTVDWPLVDALKIGDRAVGVPVLSDLYARLKDAPGEIDLSKLWRELGVSISDGEIVFNDQAPLAKVRRALTQPSG